MDYFLLKNALKGHNLVLFGSFSLPIQDFLEAPIGFEPTRQGFADPCLTAWLRGQTRYYIIRFETVNVNDKKQPTNESELFHSFCRLLYF